MYVVHQCIILLVDEDAELCRDTMVSSDEQSSCYDTYTLKMIEATLETMVSYRQNRATTTIHTEDDRSSECRMDE
jgi:hypothetical protein